MKKIFQRIEAGQLCEMLLNGQVRWGPGIKQQTQKLLESYISTDKSINLCVISGCWGPVFSIKGPRERESDQKLLFSANLAGHPLLLWRGCPLWFAQSPAGVCKETEARVLEPSEFWFIIQSPSITSQVGIYSRVLSQTTTCSLPVMVSCPRFLVAGRNWAVFFAYSVCYYSFSSLKGKKRYS